MLAEKLTELRTQKTMTHQQMADMLGITRPAYTAYESGTRKPEYETLEKIANFFQVSIDYLLGRTVIKQVNQLIEASTVTYFDGDEEILTEDEIQYLKLSLEAFRKFNEMKQKKAKS